LETDGQPNLFEVAHELNATTISTIPTKAINLFFIWDIFYLTNKSLILVHKSKDLILFNPMFYIRRPYITDFHA
jgi:hypothetical protein